MATLLDRGEPAPIENLPLEVILEIAERLDSLGDKINFALSYPPFLAYWRHQRPITTIQDGPLRWKTVTLSEPYSKFTAQRLFSPETRRLMGLILSMPNPSDKKYDIEYHKKYSRQTESSSAYELLFECKKKAFETHYCSGPKYREPTFTFQSLNQTINPLHNVICQFSTDFAMKSLSDNPGRAHHSPAFFSHPSLSLLAADSLVLPWTERFTPQHYEIERDRSPVRDLSQLHETERERLILAFYQYEAMCVTSAKITGYGEIQRVADLLPSQYCGTTRGWNRDRTLRSPLADQSHCQIERVKCVYSYVSLQYRLMFRFLWLEYRSLLDKAIISAGASGVRIPRWGDRPRLPAIFQDESSLSEWIDVLSSRGLLFLHRVLSMDRDQRREFLCRTYYPTRASEGDENLLFKGIFHTLEHQRALPNFEYSDAIEDASGQNYAWVCYNSLGDGAIRSTTFSSPFPSILRRRGYVFWNKDRCMELGLTNPFVGESIEFYNFNNFLDPMGVPMRTSEGEQVYLSLPEAVWLQAGEPFMTPRPRPCLLEFGILGETWRIGEQATVLEDGEPILPTSMYL
ncbi:hypothetical protein F5Y07DRAFT_407201 [Xylaria sp. FL0933]|nr:hypothetical protein F5Y07DRAFT_407201 [Xylaria sp. FL0933]